MIEIIKARFAAGEVKTFLIQGEYVEILEAAYPVDVAMMDRSGAQLSTMRNAEASYFSRPGKYEVIQVTSNAAQTIRLFVGSGDAGTRRTSGDVSVVDGGKNKVIAGKAFFTALNQPAAPGLNAQCQLWNPIDSGVNIVVSNYGFSTDIASVMVLRSSTSPLTVLQGNPPSKKLGGNVAISEGRAASSGAVTLGAYYPAPNMAANSTFYQTLKEPMVVPPGFGLCAQAVAVNSTLGLIVEFTEELI